MRPNVARVIKKLEAIASRKETDFGAKARSLASLARAGLPVPPAYVIPGWVCDAFFSIAISVDEHPRELVRQASLLTDDRLASIAQKVIDRPLPQAWESSIVDALIALRHLGFDRFAVRSSAMNEDRHEFSSTGLYRTVVNVITDDEVLQSVKEVWASVFQQRVLLYHPRNHTDFDPRVGVIIQALVPSDVAGVMFTCNPLTADLREVVVNSSYGLGSSVVEGVVSPDTFRVDKQSRQQKEQIVGHKDSYLFAKPGGGVQRRDTVERRRIAPSLDSHTLRSLVDLGIRTERHFGSPQDIEWAVNGNDIHLLQVRPITTMTTAAQDTKAAVYSDRSRLVWSNVNVGEALPGVATPLTWSVLSRFSELGFRRAFGALGCTVPRDAELVGSFRGRIYLNMTEFTHILAQVPGIRPQWLVSLGGGGYDDLIDEMDLEQSSRGFLLRFPRTATRYVRENFGLQARVSTFEKEFESERRRLSSIDPRLLPPDGLDQMLTDVEHLLDETGAIMLTVYSNLLVAILLLWGVQRVMAQGDSGLRRDLLSGLADIPSAQPGVVLWQVAQEVQRDEVMQAWLESTDLCAPGLDLGDAPEGKGRRAVERYLQQFGHRAMREAEIAEKRWSEDPSLILSALLLLRSQPDPEISLRRQAAKRQAAEKDLLASVPFAARPALSTLIKSVQRLTRTRERLRDHVIEVLGLYRRVALDASRRIEVREPESGSDAAFFLSLDELHHILHSPDMSVALHVQRRRQQYERDTSLPDPPGTFVGFPPEAPSPVQHKDMLKGIAGSAGIKEGTARVIDNAADASMLKLDEILVVSAADSGWSPLFLVSGAVVTELGGPLSHAAIILREYGVPAVVNVAGATRSISSGDRVRVDGTLGTVEILERA